MNQNLMFQKGLGNLHSHKCVLFVTINFFCRKQVTAELSKTLDPYLSQTFNNRQFAHWRTLSYASSQIIYNTHNSFVHSDQLFYFIICVPVGYPGAMTVFTDGYEPPCSFWKLNLDVLYEQHLLLTTDSLSSPKNNFNKNNCPKTICGVLLLCPTYRLGKQKFSIIFFQCDNTVCALTPLESFSLGAEWAKMHKLPFSSNHSVVFFSFEFPSLLSEHSINSFLFQQ